MSRRLYDDGMSDRISCLRCSSLKLWPHRKRDDPREYSGAFELDCKKYHWRGVIHSKEGLLKRIDKASGCPDFFASEEDPF